MMKVETYSKYDNSPIQLSITERNYNLCLKQNSWEEFIMLSDLILKIGRAIEYEHDQKTKKRLKRKRKRSDSLDSNSDTTSDEDDSESREVKRLKIIEKRLKRKYQEMLYG